MKNGSSKSSKTPKVVAVDVASAPLVKHHEAPPTAPPEPPALAKGRMKALEPIPEEAANAPVEWAEKHLQSLAPAAAKEQEWALYFGSDSTRREVAKDILAMSGITTKPKETAAPVQAVILNLGLPVAASGAPVLPFSNAPALDSGAQTVTVAPAAPTTEPKK